MGSATMYTALPDILIHVVMSTRHPRCRRHPARPGHNGLKKTGSCPQGASRSDKPGQVPPPPRRLVLCERWQEAQEEPKAHTEDQGNPLFPLGKAVSPPCAQQCWGQQPYLRLLAIYHPASCPYLRIKSKALPWEFPGRPVVRTPRSHCRGPRVQSGWGNSNCIKSRTKQGKGINIGQNGKGKISPILLKSRQSYTDYHLHARNNFFSSGC